MNLRAISLGWGIQSWTLAAMSALGELEPIDVALHSDTTWERAATYEFAKWGTVWLGKHGLPVPPKSSCVFCPYHTRKGFAEMKRVNGPDWQTAVMVDEAIRDKRPGFVAYVHPDRIPLIELKIAEDFGATQMSFIDTVNAECDSGYCFL